MNAGARGCLLKSDSNRTLEVPGAPVLQREAREECGALLDRDAGEEGARVTELAVRCVCVCARLAWLATTFARAQR